MISIILTSYNHEKYIATSIKSALNQTYKDFELIIIDECSTDASWRIIDSFNDSRIKKIRLDTHIGNEKIPMLLKTIINPDSKYIAMHHSDDSWAANKLELQVAFLETHPEVAACFTRVQFINETDELYFPKEGHFYRDVFEQCNRSRQEWLRYFFEHGNCLCHPSLLIRKKAYEDYGLLAVGMRQLTDFYQWIRLCRHAEIYILPERLTYFRLRTKEQTQASAETPEKLTRSATEMYLLMREFEDIIDPDDFFEVFPDAIKFCTKENFHAQYAYARILMASEQRYKFLHGSQIMFDLVNNPVSREALKKQFDYSHIEFSAETGNVDVFSSVDVSRFITVTIHLWGDDEYVSTIKTFITSDSHFYTCFIVPALRAEKIMLRIDDNYMRDFESVEVKVNAIPLELSYERQTKSCAKRFFSTCSQVVNEVEVHGVAQFRYAVEKNAFLYRRLVGILKFAMLVPRLYICGAGNIAVQVAKLMREYDISFEGFVVSNDQITSDRQLYGKPLIYIEELPDNAKDSGFIVAVSEQYQGELEANLIAGGCRSIFFV